MKVFFLHVFVLLFFCRIFSRHLFREGIANLIHANQCHTLVSHHTNKLSTHFKGTSIFHSIWFQLTLKRYQNRISIDTYVRTYTRQHAYIDAYALLLTPPRPHHHPYFVLGCIVQTGDVILNLFLDVTFLQSCGSYFAAIRILFLTIIVIVLITAVVIVVVVVVVVVNLIMFWFYCNCSLQLSFECLLLGHLSTWVSLNCFSGSETMLRIAAYK